MGRSRHPMAWYRARWLRWAAEYVRGDQVMTIARRDGVSIHAVNQALRRTLGCAPRIWPEAHVRKAAA